MNCKTTELKLLPAAKQERRKESTEAPTMSVEWKVFQIMSTSSCHLNEHDIWTCEQQTLPNYPDA